MDVKACDNCKKLNTEADKSFALVGPSIDYNNPKEEKDKAMVAVYIGLTSGAAGRFAHKNAKMLCSECTMPYATELVKQLFSKENMAKL